MKYLSKSKIIAFRLCPKRLWLELHKSELREDSDSETVFQVGYQVGNIARTIHDSKGSGETIDIETLGHSHALKRDCRYSDCSEAKTTGERT